MQVSHVRLEVRLLLELLVAYLAFVELLVALAVDTGHVAAQGAFPLELLHADVAVVTNGLVLGHDVHVPAAGRPELFAAELAGERLGHGVDGLHVPRHVGSPGEALVADLALVVRVLVLGLGMDCEAGLGLVRLAAGEALERGAPSHRDAHLGRL